VPPSLSPAARGYGSAHRAERRRWAPFVEAGEVVCWRCRRLIVPGTPWDLGHDDRDRTCYRGPEHRRCNRATEAHAADRKRRRAAAARGQSRGWLR